MIGIGRDSCLRGKIVRGAERDDSERRVEAIEAIHDFVDRTVTTKRDDDIRPRSRRRRRHSRSVARLERYARFHDMTLATHPIDQMAHVLALRARAMNDHCKMFPA